MARSVCIHLSLSHNLGPSYSLKLLSYLHTMKTIHLSLIVLLSGHQVNTIDNLKVRSMYISDTECTFAFSSVLKHSRPSYHQQPLILRSITSNLNLCPVTYLTDISGFDQKNLKTRNPSSHLFHHKNNVQKTLLQDGSKKPYLLAGIKSDI